MFNLDTLSNLDQNSAALANIVGAHDEASLPVCMNACERHSELTTVASKIMLRSQSIYRQNF